LSELALRYNRGYTNAMKTAISIPDELFVSAEQFAKQRGLSRSELYVTALRQYLNHHDSEAITQQLDALYSDERSALDPDLTQAQTHGLPKDAW
jgi:metal-responsive CopG/Arc/MetJ family transcriptional regulator